MGGQSIGRRTVRYLAALRACFRQAPSKHEAHARSRGILQDISGDAAFLTEVLEQHLMTPGALNARNYPVVGLDVDLNVDFGLVVNCWIPLPDRRTTLSTKAIHHHGTMLLTTATMFGPGYEHWTFQPPQVLDPESHLYALQLIQREPHPTNHVAFVSDRICHLPMYPSDSTITLALWSSKYQTSWKDHLKRIPMIQDQAKTLRALVTRLGLSRALDLKVVEYFDFFPTERGFQAVKERQEFPLGPNEDRLHSLFHVLQRTGNDRLAPLVRARLNADRLENHQTVTRLLADLESGRPIEGRLSRGHTGVPFANFTSMEVERTLALLDKELPVSRAIHAR